MYDISTRKRALSLVAQGRSLNSVSKETGISRHAITCWLSRLEPLTRMATADPGPPADDCAYSYLLGLYLGDGCISAHPRGTGYYLAIACADAWPGLMQQCREAIQQVRPGIGVYTRQKKGCSMVTSYSRHWPRLFPQHGPGRKHERPIALAPWQQQIVDAHPWEFVRGLIHSDGCRITNWTTRLVAGERKRYEYPRYFFTNTSTDIVRLFTDALDRVGIEWKPLNQSRAAVTISVARKASVALMDTHIGPKH
ncbi:helix-turn-helix domain-containing protein [Streptomyces sp. NPDC051133]|uniref:helix-turn-helix domain-containing protein n=1 Tax=Streptomyces sp. NPDC051133 TaxID=3155521 RepID=UPI00341B3B1F